MSKLATQINALGQFCCRRDLPELSQAALQQTYQLKQADVFVFFGGSIVGGVATLAQAIHAQVARHYVIVGGYGHTTAALIKSAQTHYPTIKFDTSSEAQIFAQILQAEYGLQVDFLETNSTNCGNNITNLLTLLTANQIKFNSLILCQDATMQLRMTAALRKYVAPSVKVINYAAYAVTVTDQLTFDHPLPGMWSLDKYVSLLLGEISRLTDDHNGYGPAGKNFIAHVAVPATLQTAAAQLQQQFTTRSADPRFAGK